LTSGSRYNFLFDIPVTDYKAWARGLKRAGYATNPDYANMLIRKIEESSLYIYDRATYVSSRKNDQYREDEEEQMNTYYEAATIESSPVNNNGLPPEAPRIMENNRIKYIIVEEGETRETLEDKFHLLRWELSKYNELNDDFIPVPGQILYLQPKRDRAEPGKETHTVNFGDTMYSISQQYGIKLEKLYELNLMDEGAEPVEGDKIWLRKRKPVN